MKIPVFIKTHEGKTFVCREPFNATELKALFQLRYAVYRQSDNDFLFPPNDYEMDIDAHDLRSLHFGIFECFGHEQRAVGSMRLITEQETRFAGWVRLIAASHSELSISLEKKPEIMLPIFKFFEENDATNMIKTLKSDFAEVSETGRFCLHNSLKNSGMARFAVTSIVNASLDYLSPKGIVLIIVSVSHVRLYTQFGFEPFAQMIENQDVPERFVLLKISMTEVRRRVFANSESAFV